MFETFFYNMIGQNAQLFLWWPMQEYKGGLTGGHLPVLSPGGIASGGNDLIITGLISPW